MVAQPSKYVKIKTLIRHFIWVNCVCADYNSKLLLKKIKWDWNLREGELKH